jgi:hypothetical protein
VTGREKQDAIELRELLFSAADWRCIHCGGHIRAHGTPQLAHRIAQSKANLKKYGSEVIHHPLNVVPVCQVEPCNSALNIGNRPEEVKALVATIEASLAFGGLPNMEVEYRVLRDEHAKVR